MEWFTPVEIFRKKSNTFRGITETAEIFCTICLDYQYQASSREKAKNLPVFCKWYNSTRSCVFAGRSWSVCSYVPVKEINVTNLCEIDHIYELRK